MLDSFAGALRALRELEGLNLEDAARLAHISKSYLGQLETGLRQPTESIAAAFDQALAGKGLLLNLYYVEKGGPVHRRRLINTAVALAGGAVAASMDGVSALAAMIDRGLRASIDEPIDWDALADDCTRRHLYGAGPEFGSELAAHLMIAQSLIDAGDRDAARGAAQLALVYGLWVADTGRVPTANALYATASRLADRSGDNHLRAMVRARAASRGPYEEWTVARVESTAQQALTLSPTGPAAVEAHSALVHLAALTGRLREGRDAVNAMYDAAETTDTSGPSPYLRTACFDNYLECRAGTVGSAHAVYARHADELTDVPLWKEEATIYLGRAMIAAGDSDGAQVALDAVTKCRNPTRIIGLGVRDVLDAAGDTRTDTLAALSAYATPGPTPWETIR